MFAYLDACPHTGVPLEWTPHRFLNAGGAPIVWSVHGADSCAEGGLCPRGPCKGDRLEAVSYEVVDGVVLVPGNAGL